MKKKLEFTSSMDLTEKIEAIGYIPIHVLMLPLAVSYACMHGSMGEAEANALVYVVGLIYMVCFLHKFLRREFDALCDEPLYCLKQVLISYGLMMLCNYVVNLTMLAMGYGGNPNNEAVGGMVAANSRPMAVLLIIMAPIIEEIMFRGGVFGAMRKYNRVLAYVFSMAAFSLYHVWGYAIIEPKYWIYLLQYIPASYILCRCYEKTNTIWASVALHMLINGMAYLAFSLMGALL